MARRLPGVQVHVFSDRDISAKADQIKAALDGADAFFGSLLFDFDQVWLRRLAAYPGVYSTCYARLCTHHSFPRC